MKTFRKELWLNVPSWRGFITSRQIEECLRKSGIRDGLIWLTRCTSQRQYLLMTMSLDSTRILRSGWKSWLRKRQSVRYRHNVVVKITADEHLKRQGMGREVVVAVTDGKLDFGPWERIFYGEFDGRRKKRVLVKIMGE